MRKKYTDHYHVRRRKSALAYYYRHKEKILAKHAAKPKDPYRFKWGWSKKGFDPNEVVEYYKQQLAKQENRCVVCGSEEGLCLDHNHSTNQLRGILCRTCNLALGNSKEDPKRLEGLIKYLSDWS